MLDAAVHGEACLAGGLLRLNGARAYAEKNWGPGFPRRWWWGQAGAFAGGEVGVAFAGGRVSLLGTAIAPTAVVLRLGSRIMSFAPPTSQAVVSVGNGSWRVRLRSATHRLSLDGDAAPAAPQRLPVPVLDPRGFDLSAHHTFAGRLRLHLSRRGRTIIEAESDLAGLEEGERLQPAPPSASLPQPNPRRR
jgi:tocopherol cyclase